MDIQKGELVGILVKGVDYSDCRASFSVYKFSMTNHVFNLYTGISCSNPLVPISVCRTMTNFSLWWSTCAINIILASKLSGFGKTQQLAFGLGTLAVNSLNSIILRRPFITELGNFKHTSKYPPKFCNGVGKLWFISPLVYRGWQCIFSIIMSNRERAGEPLDLRGCLKHHLLDVICFKQRWWMVHPLTSKCQFCHFKVRIFLYLQLPRFLCSNFFWCHILHTFLLLQSKWQTELTD